MDASGFKKKKMLRDYCENIGLMLPSETFGKSVRFEKPTKVKKVQKVKKKNLQGWCECGQEHKAAPTKPFAPGKNRRSDLLDAERLVALEGLAKCPYWSRWMSLSDVDEVAVEPTVVLSRKDVSAAVEKAKTAATRCVASCELFFDGGDDAVFTVSGDRKILLVRGLSSALSQHVLAVCKDACVRKVQEPLTPVSAALHKLYLRYAANCTKFPLSFEQWSWAVF